MQRAEGLRGQLELEDRVKFVGRLDDAEMIDHLARCRAVVFPPFNEDYGFVTVEAFMCGKPVITCTDSGGPPNWCATARTASSPIRRPKRWRWRCGSSWTIATSRSVSAKPVTRWPRR